MTEKLVAFVRTAGASRGDNFRQLYDNFVSEFESRVDQLQLAIIAVAAAAQLAPTRPPVAAEVAEAEAFIVAFKEKKERLGDPAYVVVLMAHATLRLNGFDDADGCKTMLEEGKKLLDGFDGADPVVYSSVYRASSEFHKMRGPASSFYDAALRFLAYTPLDTLPAEERHVLAQDMALAALVGENVYNFGEVVQHPVLASLTGTPEAWLGQLLEALHRGDIDAFNATVAANRAAYRAQPALVANEELTKKKVSLLCVMEMAAAADPSDRTISFGDIARATRLETVQVEWLLMEAMQLGLIKGSIDEIDQTVTVTYVKPRVLDMTQLAKLKDKIDTWHTKTKATRDFIEDNTGELFT